MYLYVLVGDVDIGIEEDLSGGRKRKEVVYDDGMTDAQYCRAMEARGNTCTYLFIACMYASIV